VRLRISALGIASAVLAASGAVAQTIAAPPVSKAAPAAAESKLARAVFARQQSWTKAPGDAQLPTALSDKLGSDNVVGAVGYLCGLGDHGAGPDAHGVRTSEDREDTFLGAQLKLSFR
jgi:hypothetical protein